MALNEISQIKQLAIEVKSANETEADSNIAQVDQTKTPSAHLKNSVTDVKNEEPHTSATEGKKMPVQSFEEEKEQEHLVIQVDSVEEECKKM